MTVINFFVVGSWSYFRDTALSIDIFANREFRATWNKVLIFENGYQFGKHGETISSALGKNQVKGTLTEAGICLVWILCLIEENHCVKSISES